MNVETNAWTHPKTGQVREYVNNWVELIGASIQYYNTGNICSAYLDGEKFSNARARELLQAKVWIDEVGGIHVDYLSERAAAVINAAEIKTRIQKCMDDGEKVETGQ